LKGQWNIPQSVREIIQIKIFTLKCKDIRIELVEGFSTLSFDNSKYNIYPTINENKSYKYICMWYPYNDQEILSYSHLLLDK
jgi:hypothetical protein